MSILSEQLIAAARANEKQTLQGLIAQGVSLEGKDDTFGRTPLAWVAREGKTDMVQLLLEQGAKPNTVDRYGGTPLQAAASLGHTATVTTLLKFAAQVNAQDNEGWTPLMMAAAHGHIDTVRVLLAEQANVHTIQAQGLTVLGLSQTGKFPHIVDLLKQFGAG